MSKEIVWESFENMLKRTEAEKAKKKEIKKAPAKKAVPKKK